MREIVIGKYEVRSNYASRDQFQRRHTARRRSREMAVAPEDLLQEFADLRVVLHDENRSCAAGAFACAVSALLLITFGLWPYSAHHRCDLDRENGPFAEFGADNY